MVPLSEQQLVSCSFENGNQGCNGGLMTYAFEYVLQNGLESEDDFPYLSGDGEFVPCDDFKVNNSRVNISQYQEVEPNCEDALMAAIARQPVSVAVEATAIIWQHYSGGVVTEGCGTMLNHGVLAVGYRKSEDPGYYIVKNSWGKEWGLAGYIKLGISKGKGVCGIHMMSSYPII